jgi:virginiamycin B lyase
MSDGFAWRVRGIIAALGLCCLIGSSAKEARASTEFSVPGLSANPSHIVTGPDGNLWITERGRISIVRLTPSGTITEFPVPGAVSLNAIIVGPDGAMWFTDLGSGQIGRINTHGVVVVHPLTSGTYAVDIASGSDGSLWFTETNTPGIGSPGPGQTPTSATQAQPDCFAPASISSNMSSASGTVNGLGRMTTNGVVTEYAGYQGSTSIISGPDGNLWLIQSGSLVQVNTGGQRVRTFTPGAGGPYISMAAGPDNNVWFTTYSPGNG